MAIAQKFSRHPLRTLSTSWFENLPRLYFLVIIKKDLVCAKSLDAGGNLVVLMLLSIRKDLACAKSHGRRRKPSRSFSRKNSIFDYFIRLFCYFSCLNYSFFIRMALFRKLQLSCHTTIIRALNSQNNIDI